MNTVWFVTTVVVTLVIAVWLIDPLAPLVAISNWNRRRRALNAVAAAVVESTAARWGAGTPWV